MKLKSFIIPLLLVFAYLVLISYPYFFSKITRFSSLGFFSVVEEELVDLKLTPSKARKTDEFDNHLLAGEKIEFTVQSSENNLGIVLFRFAQLSAIVTDSVVFRIKEKGADKWHYENTYKADQFQGNEYFTFGFPPLENSKSKTYVAELESLSGTYEHGIGFSRVRPQAAIVYSYTREQLKDLETISSFIIKKLVYVLNNLDIWQNWRILIASLFIYLSIYFISKGKITFTKKKGVQLSNTTGFLPVRLWFGKLTIAQGKPLLEWGLPGRPLKRLANKMKSKYLLRVKIIVRFSKKLTRDLYAIKFYSLFLNTNMKKRLAIGFLIFLLAFLNRLAGTSPDQLGVSSFYAGLGGQGDYDQFIRAATCAVRTFCPAILGQNFLIESSVLGAFYEIFGFAGGLKAYLYLMLILSSIVATLPYVLLSRKNFLTIGGIIGGLFLATSDYFTHMAINLPPDNGSLFTFSMFFIVYLLTIHPGTIRWLLFLGLAGTIDGLNKLVFLINDLAVFMLFAPVFFIEKAKKIKKFPFVKFNSKLIFYSILPLLVFLVIYSTWEYVVQIKFERSYYLRALIEGSSTYASSTIEASSSINESASKGNILGKLYYYAGLSIVMLKRIIDNAGLNTMLLAPILIGLLYATFRKPIPIKSGSKFFITKLISVVIFAGIAFTTLVLFKNNYLGIQDIGQYVYVWSDNIYVNVFIFWSIIFLFTLNFKYQALKYVLPIIAYVIMIILLTKNAPWLRMLAHVIVWGIILLSFLIDWILSNDKKNILKRLWIGPVILVLFISFYTIPTLSSTVGKLSSGINNARNEVKYLKWVNSELPENAVILLGGKSDLVTVDENVKRPIIYNTMWAAAIIIKPKEIPRVKPTDFTILNDLKINEMPGVAVSDFSMIEELKSKENFTKSKYLILENDISLWRARLTGIADSVFATTSGTLLNPFDYSIKVYKFNSTLNKGIYELNLKEDKGL